MQVLVPITLTDAMVTTWGAAEPAASETAWATATAYVLGDLRIRAATHRKYKCILAHTSGATTPENDPDHWQDVGPTLRYAMFDTSGSTQTSATSPLTVVVEPGNFNAICLYNLSGTSISVTVKDTPGGTTIYSYSGALDGPYIDWYEWLFDPFRSIKKLVLSDITPYSTAEVTITVTDSTGASPAIGVCLFGDLRSLVTDGNTGGTQWHARAEAVDYSYVTVNDYGESQVMRRPSGTDMRASVWLEQSDADYAISVLQAVIGTPTGVIATTESGYDGLNVFGLVNASLSYDSVAHATLDITVKGLT